MRSEKHVIHRVDDAYVAELFQRYGEELTGYLKRLLHSHALAREVVQETYERLCTKDLHAISNLRAYLFRVGTGIAIDHLRRRKFEATALRERVARENDSNRLENPETRAVLDEKYKHLERQINRLSPQLREVIVMRFMQDMDPSEIVKRLNISMSAYEQRVTAARHQLRKRLRSLGIDLSGL